MQIGLPPGAALIDGHVDAIHGVAIAGDRVAADRQLAGRDSIAVRGDEHVAVEGKGG